MAKVITFSRAFPKGHARAGQPTFFVEKFWKSIWDQNKAHDIHLFQEPYDDFFHPMGKDSLNVHQFEGKHHTLRAGNRFKSGEFFSPRVWSGKPYNSKQIIIGPDTKIENAWDVVIFAEPNQTVICMPTEIHSQYQMLSLGEVAKNDGLTIDDFESWFNPKRKSIEFQGQIICWNQDIEY